MYAALRNLDLNSDGLLSRDELTKGLSDLRLGLTAAQIRVSRPHAVPCSVTTDQPCVP